ncbi:MAG: flippase [Chloroflexia bacterium]
MSSKTPTLFTNAIANYAGQISSIAVGILLTPVIISNMGTDMYGLWVLVVAIQGLGGLLDFGVTTSVVKYVAEHHARDEIDEINRVVSTSFFLHLFIGVLAFAAVLIGAWYWLPLLQLTAQQLDVGRQSLIIAGATLMLSLPLGVLGNLLTGLRRYEVSNGVNIVQTVVSAGAILVALQLGGGPTALVAINGVGLVTAYAIKWVFARRVLPGLRLSPRFSSRATLGRIGSYSLWLFLLDTAKRIFYNADAVLIAAFLPVSKVTAYNLGFKPASAVSYFSGPLVSVFLPAASELEARKDTARLQSLFITGTRVAVALTLPPVLWLLAFGRQAMEVWVGPGHEDALPVMYLFLGVFLVSAVQNPAGVILKGIGQVRAFSLVVMAEYAVNIAISLLLIPRLGVVGAVLGTLIPAVVADLVVIPWLACRELGVDYPRFIIRTMVGPLVAAALSLALLLPLGYYLSASTLATVGGGAVIALSLFGSFYFLLGASKEEKEWMSRKLQQLRGPADKREIYGNRTTDKHSDTDQEPAGPAHPDTERPQGTERRPPGV